jgi:hypothetical protein
MRAGETKYKGEIMAQLSKIRWNKQGHNQLAFKDIALVLDKAKKDFPNIIPCVLWEDKEHPDEKPTILQQVPNSPFINYYEVDGKAVKAWFEKWFGAQP